MGCRNGDIVRCFVGNPRAPPVPLWGWPSSSDSASGAAFAPPLDPLVVAALLPPAAPALPGGKKPQAAPAQASGHEEEVMSTALFRGHNKPVVFLGFLPGTCFLSFLVRMFMCFLLSSDRKSSLPSSPPFISLLVAGGRLGGGAERG